MLKLPIFQFLLGIFIMPILGQEEIINPTQRPPIAGIFTLPTERPSIAGIFTLPTQNSNRPTRPPSGQSVFVPFNNYFPNPNRPTGSPQAQSVFNPFNNYFPNPNRPTNPPSGQSAFFPFNNFFQNSRPSPTANPSLQNAFRPVNNLVQNPRPPARNPLIEINQNAFRPLQSLVQNPPPPPINPLFRPRPQPQPKPEVSNPSNKAPQAGPTQPNRPIQTFPGSLIAEGSSSPSKPIYTILPFPLNSTDEVVSSLQIIDPLAESSMSNINIEPEQKPQEDSKDMSESGSTVITTDDEINKDSKWFTKNFTLFDFRPTVG